MRYGSREDQAKVRRALASRKVDPADVPDSAKLPDENTLARVAVAPGPSQKKRKATQDAPSQAPRTSQASHSNNVRFEAEDEWDDEDIEEEVKDELYCVLSSKIVGVQHYHGMVGPGEEVRLVRQPTNPYDR